MPAGDLITTERQAELQGLLMGELTIFRIGPSPIKGLGTPAAKTADVVLDGQDGSYGGPDFLGTRVISIPLLIGGDNGTPADAMNGLRSLSTAWAPVSADVELHLRLAGWGHFKVSGRPRGVDEDLTELEGGIVAALCTFEALNPAITYL